MYWLVSYKVQVSAFYLIIDILQEVWGRGYQTQALTCVYLNP